MKRTRLWVSAVLALLLLAPTLPAQKKRDDSANARTVQGSVTSPEGIAVSGAVVQLKNVKTLQIRSFITKEDGTFYFNGLSADIDYELKAESRQGESSPTKTLSSFDSRKEAIINLQLKKK
ncbi:MAG TPA: carboxypeptidase-like regulatory domain-containing protein [Bryobacteraceae bacterium]|jgi:hypothetical protein|nr:carboxypeptidase-like regulatory domain-containing protein [Bryobacteraceae bacterium]